jgi:hypothetical protein
LLILYPLEPTRERTFARVDGTYAEAAAVRDLRMASGAFDKAWLILDNRAPPRK